MLPFPVSDISDACLILRPFALFAAACIAMILETCCCFELSWACLVTEIILNLWIDVLVNSISKSKTLSIWLLSKYRCPYPRPVLPSVFHTAEGNSTCNISPGDESGRRKTYSNGSHSSGDKSSLWRTSHWPFRFSFLQLLSRMDISEAQGRGQGKGGRGRAG